MAPVQFKKGDIIRRNRQPGEVDKVTAESIHIKLMTDFTFRVFKSEIIPMEKAAACLRKRPAKGYTWMLVRKPDDLEHLCGDDIASVCELVLQEWNTPFGKREFKQVLLQDDQVVADDQWNSFWTRAYKAMRENAKFTVDDRSRYALVEVQE